MAGGVFSFELKEGGTYVAAYPSPSLRSTEVMVSIPVIARSGRAKRRGATKQSLHAISYMIFAKIA